MNIINEILKEFLVQTNEDMLIVKPNLFCYQPVENLDDAKESGIKHFDNIFWCFFQRIPDELKSDKNYLIRISAQKLKRIKDQEVSMLARNIPGYITGQKLTDDDIKKLCQKNSLISDCLKQGGDLKDAPSCILSLSNGFLPKWTYKIIENDTTILEFRRMNDEQKIKTLKKILNFLKLKLNEELDKHDNKITIKIKFIKKQIEKIEFKIKEIESVVV